MNIKASYWTSWLSWREQQRVHSAPEVKTHPVKAQEYSVFSSFYKQKSSSERSPQTAEAHGILEEDSCVEMNTDSALASVTQLDI